MNFSFSWLSTHMIQRNAISAGMSIFQILIPVHPQFIIFSAHIQLQFTKMKHILVLALLLLTIHSFNFRQVQSISQTSRVINTLTNNTFKLDRTTDNSYTQTAYKTTPVASDASVIIIFPSVFTLGTGVTCLSLTVDSVAVNSFTCSVSGSSVTFVNAFRNITSLNVGIVLVTVGNILNPSPAITISNFTGYIGVDYAVPLGASVIQLLPGAFQNCGVTFTPGFVNLASSSLVATMTPTDPHPVGTTLIMQFPRSTWTNDISSQSLPITSIMTCSSNTGSGTFCNGTASSNLVTFNNIFSNTTSSTFSITISNFLSPPSNQPSDAIVITTYQSGSKLDTCTVYPSGLTPIVFSNFTVTPTGSMTINSLASLRFNLYPSMAINQSDYFSITFPNNTSYTYNQIFGTGYYISPPTFSGQTVLIYHDTTSSASSYPQNSLYSLTFASFQAPASTAPTGNLLLQILRNGYPIMYGNAVLTATSASLSASVSVTNTVVWASTSYIFSINISNPLSSTGMIQITFPSTITPPSTANCASLLGSSLNPNPTCSFSSGSNSILITNLNASSSVSIIPSQDSIILSINGVINPPDTTTTGSFTITTYYTSNTVGVVQTGIIAGVTSTVGTISINTVSVVPSSYVAMQSGVTYSVNFNNTYFIPINGNIVLRVPTDITIVTALLPNYCKLSINGANYTSTTCSVSTSNTSFYQISFTAPAQTNAIAANSLISLQIFTLCTNPTNTRIITPFSIFTNSATAAIESRTTGITVQMQFPAAFTIVQVTRNSQQNSALAQYTITLKQQAALVAGSLFLVTLPDQISLTSTSACTDLTGTVLTCNEGSYHSMQVTLGTISANSQFGVIISAVRNPPSYKPTATNFTFQTRTSDLINSFASGIFSTPFVNSVPSTFQLVSYSFSPAAYGSNETLTLTVTPSIYASPQAYIVGMAASFTVLNLSCSSQIGFTAPCSPMGSSSINISGTLGSSQVQFSISGFVSPVAAPSDFSFISSYDGSGFLIDQNTNTIKYSLTCQVPCKSCTSNVSVCLGCYNNTAISLSNLYLPNNNSCLTSCPSEFYANVNLVCVACSSTCLTCSVSPSNCSSCNLNSTFPALNITSFTGACLSACPTFYYLSTSLSPSQCTSCVSPCLSCSALNTCSSCTPGNYFSNQSCLTSCPSNITIPNNGSWTCQSCSSQCATCMGTVSTCTSCSSSAAYYNGQCVTSCPFPLVISSGTCASCNTTCSSCSLLANNCTSCSSSSSQPFLLVTNSSIGSCLATCPFTYYSDAAQGLCKLCSTLNISCTNCSSATTCYNCDFGSGLVFYNNQCLSYVPTGFYNDSGIARACNSNCSSCSSPSNCSSCTFLSLSNFQCVSTCPGNQVSVARVCVSCSFPCLSCSNIPNNCTSCDSNATNSYFLLSGSCVQTCPNYTFANPNGWICSACISPCEMCSTNASCSSCTNGFNLFNQTCSVNCPLGFIGLNKICQPCTNSCASCTGSTSNCLTCIAGTYLYNSSTPSCSSTCPTNLYPNNFTQTCTGCTSPCTFCSGFASNCTSCLSGLLLQSGQCVSNCSVGFFPLGSNCIACNSTCTQCTSQSICLSCSSPYVLSGTTCVTTCPPSTPIVNSANKCSACTDPSCVNCSSVNYCYQCFYPKLFFQGACLTTCPTNFVVDQNYTTCIYSPAVPTNETAATLSNSLISTSIFPVPFSIGAAFLIIACLMSKFQHQRTDIIASLYSLWGLLEWGSIAFLLVYYWSLGQTVLKLSYLLVVGGFIWLYMLNIVFLFVQGFSLRKNKRFMLWMDGSINTCWYGTIACLALLTIGKIKFIIFCKLFNFRALSAKLDSVGGLRSLHAYSFASIIASLATIGGGTYLLIQTNFIVNQLLMAILDVVILSLLQLIIGICNVNKQSDYFQDIDEDGLIINKRIEIREEERPSGIMPDFNESERDSYRYKALDSAKKLQSSYLSEISSHKSLRDISIQAQSILGQRSLISRLGTQTISDLSLFDRHDVSIQMDLVRDMQDVSIAASDRGMHDVSIAASGRGMHDVSIAASDRGMHDVSIAASSLKERHDVSIGQSVIFKDVSVNHSMKMQDMSVVVDRVSQMDASVDQTQKFREEVSVQFQQNRCEISIQMDNLQQNQISVQYVPIYTDQTVHMTKDEEQLGIQCNASHQNISVQYSAKPLIEQVDELLPSNTSQSVDEPSDLDLQRKLVMHPPAPQEIGLRAELELDIQEKLERKRKELQKLQEERKQRERQDAIRDFQSKVEKKEISVQMGRIEGNEFANRNQRGPTNQHFNNQYSSISNSLVHSNQELTLNLQERIEKKQNALQTDKPDRSIQGQLKNFKKKPQAVQHSNETEEDQLHEKRPDIINANQDPSSLIQFNHEAIQDIQEIFQQNSRQRQAYQHNNEAQERELNIFFNNDPSNRTSSNFMQNEHQGQQASRVRTDQAPEQASRVKTQQEFLEMLSGNHMETPLEFSTEKPEKPPAKFKFQTANNVIQYEEQLIQDEDLIENYEPLEQNTVENPLSVEKSRSTLAYTGRPPLPRRVSNALQSSGNSIQKSYEEEDNIVNHPKNPKIKDFQGSHRVFKKQEVEKGAKTNLTQFLQKKKRNLQSQAGSRRNNLMQQEDVLSKELQNQNRQKPLPPPSAELFGTEQSFTSYNQANQRNRQTRQSFQQLEDLLAIQAQKSLSRPPNNLPRSNSRKQMQVQVGIERPKPKSRSYLRQTYSSQQKKKSLEKIYLNKVVKK